MVNKTRVHLDPAADDAAKGPAEFLTKEQFGRRVYRIMTEKGMRQSDLARAAELPRDSISQYVRGKQFPTPHSLSKLASALGMEPTDLLPNHIHAAITEDSPTLEFKISSGDPSRALLRINRIVKPATAVKIIELLNEDDTPND